MTSVIIHRILQTLLVIVVMSALVFAGLYVIGDPINMLVAPDATALEREAVRKSLGLNLPLWQQYLIFLDRAAHLDFGNSFLTGESALRLILQRMPATLELATAAMLISMVVGIPLGIYAGLKPGALPARTIMGGSVLGFSLPNFWVGLMLILLFAVVLGWLPAGGRAGSPLTASGLRSLILPACTIAISKGALIIRVTRAATRECLPQDYIKFARAKGLTERRILGVHLLKNILIPIITIGGLEYGQVFAFAVVTETVFSWPGMGKLLIDSILNLDRPVVVAYLILAVIFLAFLNLVVDVLYAVLDPRVRAGVAR